MIGWRLYTALAACAVFFCLIFAVYYYAGAATKAEHKAQVAGKQADNNAAAVHEVDHYNQTTTVIREKADAAATTIQSQPGADTAVPDGVLSSWRSSIDRMRDARPATGNHPS